MLNKLSLDNKFLNQI